MRIVLCCCGVSVTHCCQQLRIKTDANLTTSSRVSPSATLYTHERDRDTAATVTERDWTLSDIKITDLSPLSFWLCTLVSLFASGPDIHTLSTDYCHLCVCDTERVNVCMRSCVCVRYRESECMYEELCVCDTERVNVCMRSCVCAVRADPELWKRLLTAGFILTVFRTVHSNGFALKLKLLSNVFWFTKIDWLIDWLIDCLIDWLIDWLTAHLLICK